MSSQVVKSFQATGLTLALDGSEDTLLRSDKVFGNDESKEGDPGCLELSVVEDESNDNSMEGIREEFGGLDGSIETLYNYMLQIQSKPMTEPDLQSINEQL